jgi:hypothetical protein
MRRIIIMPKSAVVDEVEYTLKLTFLTKNSSVLYTSI